MALLAAMGMTKSQIEAQLAEDKDRVTWVWPQNWKTVQLYLAMQTQWRTGMAGATGLDYAALPIAAQGLRIRLKPARVQGVQVMEREALRLMAAQRGTDGG